MSSLIYLISEQQIVVATDTLATTVTGWPVNYTSKALLLPHLRMMICTTGVAGFADHWFAQVNREAHKSILHLDEVAPENLSALWESYAELHSIPSSATCTIYHFGISQEDGSAHGFVYRSENEFQSEHKRNLSAAKPTAGLTAEDLDVASPKEIILLMEKQRAAQLEEPEDRRVYIGGEVTIVSLSKDGFNVLTPYKFEETNDIDALIFE